MDKKGEELAEKADEYEEEMKKFKKELKTNVLKLKHKNNWIDV